MSIFQLNKYKKKSQQKPFISALQNKKFVAIWESDGVDKDNFGISGRIFDDHTNMTSNEFIVNTYVKGDQLNPSLLVFKNCFIAFWQSFGIDKSGYGISAQKFFNNGTKLGQEFIVNTYVKGDQTNPKAITLDDDKFLIIWQSFGIDKSGYGISAQKFFNNGTKLGNEFVINQYSKNDQINPQIARTPTNDLFVLWQSFGIDKNDYGISGRLLYPNASFNDREFVVNSFNIGNQMNPKLSSNSKGTLVVWESEGVDRDGYGISGQMFDEFNIKFNGEFIVNSFSDHDQLKPDLINVFENFIVTWETELKNTDTLIRVSAQLITNNATREGREFFVEKNSFMNLQFNPKVLSFGPNITNTTFGNYTADNSLLFAWQGINSKNDSNIYAKFIYNFSTLNDLLIAPTMAPVISPNDNNQESHDQQSNDDFMSTTLGQAIVGAAATAAIFAVATPIGIKMYRSYNSAKNLANTADDIPEVVSPPSSPIANPLSLSGIDNIQTEDL